MRKEITDIREKRIRITYTRCTNARKENFPLVRRGEFFI
jgi:hypothetical protein